MRSSALFSQSLTARRRGHIIGSAAAGVAVLGVFAQDVIAYFCIAIPCIIPLFLWLRAGAFGMPVLPALFGLFFVYYALPLLRSEITIYGPDQLFWAAVTVGSFLIAASIACWPFLGRMPKRVHNSGQRFVSDTRIVRLVFAGLVGGIIYHLALISGKLDWLGSSIGVVRGVVYTLVSVACYLLGCARASRLLVGGRWALACGGLSILIVLALSNLIMIQGIMDGLAAVLGYVLTAKRIPWIRLGAAFAMLSILHAGKFEMRDKYYLAHTQTLQQSSIFQVPAMMADWFTAGIESLAFGQTSSTVFERASLLHMLLLVQRTTPAVIPYLNGQTYAMLPAMLVPRFIDRDKPVSQAGLNLLSVRYGLQYVDSAAAATIGWGLVAEAYANFGYLAVILVGALIGALCGALMRLSAGAAPLSLSMFATIVATMILFNIELDLSYLIATLGQAFVAVLLVAALPKLWKGRRTTGRLFSEVPSP
jgi:hypothetical protein